MNERHFPGLGRDRLIAVLLDIANQTENKTHKEFIELAAKKLDNPYASRPCAACGGHVSELYMVHNEIWRTVMPSPKGHLHLHCLERRLGRFLTIEDFTNTAVNEMIFFGHRMNVQQVNFRDPPVLAKPTVEELIGAVGGPDELLKVVEKAATEEMAQAVDKEMFDAIGRARHEILAAWHRLDQPPAGRKLIADLLVIYLGFTLPKIRVLRRLNNRDDYEQVLMDLTDKLGLGGPEQITYAYLTDPNNQIMKKTAKKRRTRRNA